jgi:hypothetical protein
LHTIGPNAFDDCNKKAVQGWWSAQAVECLPSKHEAEFNLQYCQGKKAQIRKAPYNNIL